MKIAVPVAGGQISAHFGHCEQFEIFEIDQESKAVLKRESHVPPPHEPGVLPRWLSEKGATMVIAGGMGMRAQQMFEQNGVRVIVGARSGDPQGAVEAYLCGKLITGENLCDH
jgi:predicted Fe-Mo cluster-binding NifX family protein